MASRKDPDPDRKPVRTLVELMETRKRLERRGRELMERARALAAKIEEGTAGSSRPGANRRSKP